MWLEILASQVRSHATIRKAGLITIAAVIAIVPPRLIAQSSPPSPDLVTLPDSIAEVQARPGQLSAARLVRSELTPSEKETSMETSVALKLRNFPELKARIGRNEIIPAQEMAARYFPTEVDYSKIVEWLRAQGFSVKPPGQDRLSVFAKGTVAQIETAFQTRFGRVAMAGKEFTSAIAAPALPRVIAASVIGVNGLQPHLRPHHHILAARSIRQAQVPGFQNGYMVSDIAHAYNLSGLASNGSGQQIAIVIDAFPQNSDLTTFWASNAVSQSTANIDKIQVVPPVTTPDTDGEATLDTEWSSGLAPGVKVRIYGVTDLSFVYLDEAYQAILNDLPSQPGLHQVSLSYGLGELYVGNSQVQTDSQYFAALAGEGVTVSVSSGDGGSSPGPGAAGDNSGPVQVETPASDPNVTAVGGTSLYLAQGSDARISESAWFLGGGGQSRFVARPAWQTGAGMPSGTGRLVPDVAFAADPDTGGYFVLGGTVLIVGGTSWSAPCWAAICSRINQARANRGQPSLGLLAPKIYALNPLNGRPDFFDIVAGSNGAYSAGSGFDLCTGLGTPNIAQLFQSLTKIVAKDLIGDGQADIVLENTVTGQRGYWALNNGQYAFGVYLPTEPTQWHIAGVGDFLGNGQSDLVWENLATGECGIWILNNGVYAYTIPLPTVWNQWQIVGAADFLGNGQADLVWENAITGERGIWILHNGVYSYTINLPSEPVQWHIAGAADFLGTGQAGLVWENTVTGERGIWILNSGVYAYSIYLPAVPVQWQIGGAADFLGTGQAGLAWQNTVTGECGIWILNSGVYAYSIYLPTVPAGWQIVDH